MRLENQVAIVTGGGQGIGRQIALRLGQEGTGGQEAGIYERDRRELYPWHQGVGANGIRRSPGGHVEERQDGREGGT